MKKNEYVSPEVEIMEVESESIMAVSGSDGPGMWGDDYVGGDEAD